MASATRRHQVLGVVIALLCIVVSAVDPVRAFPCAISGHVGIGFAGPSGLYHDAPEVLHIDEDARSETFVQVTVGESTNDADTPISFRVEAVSGTAVVGEDVIVSDAVHVIDPRSNLFANVPFTLIDDGVVEGNERFELRLVDVTGAVAEVGSITVVIGEPTWPAVSLTDPAGTLISPGLIEGDDAPDIGLIRFELDRPHDLEVVVDWDLDHSSGDMGLVPGEGRLTIPAGDTFVDLTIATVPDVLHNSGPGERLVQLRDVEGARFGSYETLVVVHEDDPASAPPFPTSGCTGETSPNVPPPGVPDAPSAGPDFDDVVELEPFSGTVEVLAGQTRDEASVLVSRERFPLRGSADEVIVASGLGPAGWADALAGAPLAADRRAPLLLIAPDRVPPEVTSEIERVLAPGGTVTILGGPSSVEPDIAAELSRHGAVQRIAGPDRVATSLAIAEELGNPDLVLVTTGYGFPDALAAGAIAGQHNGVVLLTEVDQPSADVRAYLDSHPGAASAAIGGPASRAFPDLEGVFGADRTATSAAVAERFAPGADTVGIARSDVPADALAAGPLLAERGAALLITTTDRLTSAIDEQLCVSGLWLGTVIVFGGDQAINPEVRRAIQDRLSGDCSTEPGVALEDLGPADLGALPAPDPTGYEFRPYDGNPRSPAPGRVDPTDWPRDALGPVPGFVIPFPQSDSPIRVQIFDTPTISRGGHRFSTALCNGDVVPHTVAADHALMDAMLQLAPDQPTNGQDHVEVFGVGGSIVIPPSTCLVVHLDWDGLLGYRSEFPEKEGGYDTLHEAPTGRYVLEVVAAASCLTCPDPDLGGLVAWFDLS